MWVLIMKVIGKTIGGKNVISDLYKYNDTHGVPLNIIIDFIYSKNCAIDWLELYKNMKLSKLIEGIEESGIEYKREIIERIKRISK